MNGAGFLLGTHQPGWLARLDVPLMVSHRTLHSRRRLPRARCRWALDSGGFTELSLFGRWQTSPTAYADAVARYPDQIGMLAWASPQDWMCEPAIILGHAPPQPGDQCCCVVVVVSDVAGEPTRRGRWVPAVRRAPAAAGDASGAWLVAFEDAGQASDHHGGQHPPRADQHPRPAQRRALRQPGALLAEIHDRQQHVQGVHGRVEAGGGLLG